MNNWYVTSQSKNQSLKTYRAMLIYHYSNGQIQRYWTSIPIYTKAYSPQEALQNVKHRTDKDGNESKEARYVKQNSLNNVEVVFVSVPSSNAIEKIILEQEKQEAVLNDISDKKINEVSPVKTNISKPVQGELSFE